MHLASQTFIINYFFIIVRTIYLAKIQRKWLFLEVDGWIDGQRRIDAKLGVASPKQQNIKNQICYICKMCFVQIHISISDVSLSNYFSFIILRTDLIVPDVQTTDFIQKQKLNSEHVVRWETAAAWIKPSQRSAAVWVLFCASESTSYFISTKSQKPTCLLKMKW